MFDRNKYKRNEVDRITTARDIYCGQKVRWIYLFVVWWTMNSFPPTKL